LDFWVPIAGKGMVRTPDGEHEVEPGVCLLLRGGDGYEFRQDRQRRFVHYWVHFDYVDEDGGVVPHRSLSLPPVYRRVGDAMLIHQLLDRVVTEFWSPVGDRSRSARWLDAALMEVARHDLSASSSPRQTEVALWIQTVSAEVQADPGRPWRVEELAGQLGYEVAYFCRLFRKHTGTSPRQFITAARMRAARFLLRDTAMPIGQIARRVGYGDVHFFSRHFSAETGCSPSQFRAGRPGTARTPPES
jgi:AraC-like DNA-binding protein